MRRDLAVAKPYARALHEVARERGQVETIARDLATIVEATRQDRELREVFARPWVSAAAKKNIAVAVADALGLSPLARDFLGLVARQGRAEHLETIAAAYQELVDRDLGRVRVRVRTAVALTDSEREMLRQRLAQALTAHGRGVRSDGAGARPLEVVLDEVVDPALLGGFVAEVDSLILDGSLDGQLARLRERLARG